jgi:hypothetical protein
VRSLPDNPLARRAVPLRPLCWKPLLLACLLLGALTPSVQLHYAQISYGWGSGQNWIDRVLIALGAVGLEPAMLYGVLMLAGWLCFALPALFRAVAFWLGAFAPGSRHSGMLDELLAATTLTDEELVAGLLAVSLPPLRRVALLGAAATALIGGVNLVCGALAEGDFHLFRMASVLLTAVAVYYGGLLAGLSLALFYLGLARGARFGPWIGVAAAAACFMQILWLGASTLLPTPLGDDLTVLSVGGLSGAFDVGVQGLLAGLLLHLSWVGAAQLAGRISATFRPALALAGPVLGPLWLYIFTGMIFALTFLNGEAEPEWMFPAVGNSLRFWGGTFVLNPAVTGMHALHFNTHWYYSSYYAAWNYVSELFALVLYTALQLSAQLATVALLAWLARDSIARWRRGEV